MTAAFSSVDARTRYANGTELGATNRTLIMWACSHSAILSALCPVGSDDWDDDDDPADDDDDAFDDDDDDFFPDDDELNENEYPDDDF